MACVQINGPICLWILPGQCQWEQRVKPHRKRSMTTITHPQLSKSPLQTAGGLDVALDMIALVHNFG